MVNEALRHFKNDKSKDNDIDALDYMIVNNLYEYNCDTWSGEIERNHYFSVKKYSGQVNYRNEIFVINLEVETNGIGGMSEGTPPSASIIRIKK